MDNGSKYDYHFIIKELAEEFEGEFTCFGENAKKDITFLVPIKKELARIVKTEKKLRKLHLADFILLVDFIGKFMADCSSNRVNINNLSEGIHKIKCKYGQDDVVWKRCGTCRGKYRDCNCFLEYPNFKII